MCGLGDPSVMWGNHLSSWVRRGDEEHGVTLCALCVLSGRNRPRWCALTPTWIRSRTWNMPARARVTIAGKRAKMNRISALTLYSRGFWDSKLLTQMIQKIRLVY
ncbi:hypothetical protein HNY73_003961 [Argiope bruennichi]|uniref:Uncharacterized protein n=1 Tax=Argiope bruennichi TaxID=94029 RepID=A0A8T0FPU0_ARGBR|nr:hypothetical protein HNY73_003961 [Argiope bruennichi]